MAVTKADVLAIINSKANGFVLEIRPENMWQDDTQTTAVTAAGQNVEYIEDQSTHGWNFLFDGTVGTAPKYQVDGNGNHYIEDPGAATVLYSTKNTQATVGAVIGNKPYAVMAALNFDTGTNQFYFGSVMPSTAGNNNNIIHLGRRSSAQVTVAHWSNDANFTTGTTINGVTAVHTAKYLDPGSKYFIDGVEEGNNATTPSSLGTNFTHLSIMARTPAKGTGSNASYFFGRAYGFVAVLGDTLTSQEQADIEEWLGIEAGTVSPGTSGSGALSAGTASVTGAGAVTRKVSAAIAAQAAAVSGVAERAVTGASTLAAQPAVTTGAAQRVVTGASTLAADRATLTGFAVPTTTGAGTLAAGTATLTVSAELARKGTSTLQAALAALDGIGQVIPANINIAGTGDLSALRAGFFGSGQRGLVSTAALAAGNATLSATGSVYIAAAGQLEAGLAVVDGAGTVSAAPRTGTGALVAQVAVVDTTVLRAVKGSGSIEATATSLAAYPWVELHTPDGAWVEQEPDWGKDLS